MRTALILGGSLLIFTTLGCTGAPEAAPTAEPSAEQAEEERAREIEALEEETARLREELRAARDRLEAAEKSEEGETPESKLPDEESARQLRRENERLRHLVEELRLALIAAEGVQSPDASDSSAEPGSAAPPAQPESPPPTSESPTEPFLGPEAPDAEQEIAESASSPIPEPPEAATEPLSGGFEPVGDVNEPSATDTPAQLASEGIERVRRQDSGYRYVDATSNDATGSGVYLQLILPRGGELPEATLEAKTVYPADSEPLIVERALFEIAGQSFDLEPAEVRRLRDRTERAETASFSLTPRVRRLLTLTQRRPEADLTVTFLGEGGESSHRVTRRERLALANMIYTLREMGGEL
ncbi:MAG: hypothetical protein ACLFQZ_05275 [Spirochaetaceae bacterium]